MINYPPYDFDQGRLLLEQLGSFWVNIFEERDRVQAFLRASGNEQGQTYINTLEAIACVSRLTVPVFHTEDWHLIVISQKEVAATASRYRSDDLVYGPQDGSVVERPAGFIQTFGGQDKPGIVQIKLPPKLVALPFTLQNFVLYPTSVLVNGVDYEVDEGYLRLRNDIFKDTRFPQRIVYDSKGNVVDIEVGVWVYRGQFDLDYVYTHFGYAIGVQLKSSRFSKEVINALFDMYVQGPSMLGFESFLSALSGDPRVRNPVETVEVVQTESDRKLVVTSGHSYSFPLTANIIVSVGDVLYAGDRMSDAVMVSELSGQHPDYSLLPALSLGTNFLSGGYFSTLTVKNHNVTVDYMGVDGDGKAIVQFEVSGYPGDVEDFWAAVHAAGKSAGKTLANYLDTRENPTTEPVASNLPTLINPMQFVLNEIMRNNLFLIKLREASFNEDAPGVSVCRFLRELTPPNTTYVVFLELEPVLETVTLDDIGDEEGAGCGETLGLLKTSGPIVETAYPTAGAPPNVLTYADQFVTAKLVSMSCQ
jgi:hypothetical protein